MSVQAEERGKSELSKHPKHCSESFTQKLTSTSKFKKSGKLAAVKNLSYIKKDGKYVSPSDPSQELISGRNEKDITAKLDAIIPKLGFDNLHQNSHRLGQEHDSSSSLLRIALNTFISCRQPTH